MLDNLLFILMLAHATISLYFFVRYRVKWGELMLRKTPEDREYHFLRARRQFFASTLTAILLMGDFLMALLTELPAGIIGTWIAMGAAAIIPIYILGKFRYDWNTLWPHIKMCAAQGRITWY